MLFLILSLCAILIAAIVVTLKKAHERRQHQLAEHDQSLPSLAASLETLTVDRSDTHEGDKKEHDGQEHDVIAPPSTTAHFPASSWKEHARRYREAGLYEEAIAAMDEAWPQWQYYEQLAITLRAAIRETRTSAPETADYWLRRLYRAAAEASLVHDKPELGNADRPNPTPGRASLAEVALPYNAIGVDRLRLLTKTDRRQMIAAWGAPAQHVAVHAYLGQN